MRLALPLIAALSLLPSRGIAGEPRAVLCVDAGHGGRQPGAIGPHQELEKQISLEVAARLTVALEKAFDAKVVMTRSTDEEVDLDDRVKVANEARADVFVSVHCNSMPTGQTRKRVQGVETYFLSAEPTGEQARRVAARENAEAKKAGKPKGDALSLILNDLAKTEAHQDASRLAYAVHQRVVKDLGATDRGVHQAYFVVLSGASMPAILLEMGFISNEAEAKLLSDSKYQQKIADSVVAGIASFFEQTGRKELVRKIATVAPEAAPAPR